MLYRGLGIEVKGKSLEEAIELADLGQLVEKTQVSTQINGNIIEVPNMMVLSKPTKTGRIFFGDCTPKYEPTQIRDLLKTFFDIAKVGKMDVETLLPIDGGRRIIVTASVPISFGFNSLREARLLSNDKFDDQVYLKVHISSGYKPGISNTVETFAERKICSNGVKLTEGVSKFRFIHRQKFGEAQNKAIADLILKSTSAFEIYHEKAEVLRTTKFSEDILTAYVVELLQPSSVSALKKASKAKFQDETSQGKYLLEEILKRPEIISATNFSIPTRRTLAVMTQQPGADLFPETAWNAFNGVTYFIDHVAGRKKERGIESSLFGSGAKLKVQALNTAMDYTKRLT